MHMRECEGVERYLIGSVEVSHLKTLWRDDIRWQIEDTIDAASFLFLTQGEKSLKGLVY
jgi:hypothetical protein